MTRSIQKEDRGSGGDETDSGLERGKNPVLAHRQPHRTFDHRSIPGGLVFLAREGFDRREHFQVLLGDRHHLGFGLLDGFGDRAEVPADNLEREIEARNQERDQQGEASIEASHYHYGTDHGHELCWRVRQSSGQEAAQPRQFVGHEREGITLPAVFMKGDRQALQVTVYAQPQVGENRRAGRPGDARRGEVHERGGRKKCQKQGNETCAWTGRGKHAPEHGSGQPGHGKRQQRARNPEPADHEQFAAIGPCERQQAVPCHQGCPRRGRSRKRLISRRRYRTTSGRSASSGYFARTNADGGKTRLAK